MGFRLERKAMRAFRGGGGLGSDGDGASVEGVLDRLVMESKKMGRMGRMRLEVEGIS